MNYAATAEALESEFLENWEIGGTRPSAASLYEGKRLFQPGPAMSVHIDSAARDGRLLCAMRPVHVSIERADGGFCAENSTLQIFAAGESAQEALADFRSQLFELYSHYARLTEDDVVGEGQRLRHLFLENFDLR